MRKIVFLLLALILCFTSISTFAGQLGQNNNGIYYKQDDGTLAKSKWITVDTDGDGLLEYYYFDKKGYLMIDCKTPDGYFVNKKGQWIVNGKVQTKKPEKKENNSLRDAYNSGIEAGANAYNAGIEIGREAVNDVADEVGNMFGGLFKGYTNEYKKEYNKYVDEYKNEFDNAVKEYSSQMDGLLKQYGY